MKLVRVFACAASALAALFAVAPPAVVLAAARETATEKPTRTIAIEVNGEPLGSDASAQVTNGRVLVPIREVLDALGIAIVRSGNAIAVRLPTGSAQFAIGSAALTVDGNRYPLDSPVLERDGTVYAPLKLVATMLGAQTNYDQRGARIEIVSSSLGRESGAQQAREDGGSDVQGVVSAIDANSQPPSITVVHGGISRTISVTSDAKIWSEDVTVRNQVKSTLDGLHVGDAVHAILASDGRVISIYDFYKSTGGTIAAVSGGTFVLQNGRVVTPAAATDVTLDENPAKISDLRPGDYVTVRSNPESGELREIVATSAPGSASSAAASPAPGSPSPIGVTSVSLSPDRPLRAGETLTITMTGPAGGVGTFDIGDELLGLPMHETTPGTYVGTFAIPSSLNLTQVPVYGKLALHGAVSPRKQAPQTLSAATTPPAIGEFEPSAGQVVNNVRPSIFATYSAPTEIPINASSVQLIVNGHDVTSAAVRTPTFITYSPGVDLQSGPVTVVVKVSDAAGNATSRSWTFSIAKH